MDQTQRITDLVNQAFRLVDTDSEKLCTRPTKANPAQGLNYIVDEMRPRPIEYRGVNEDGTHNFTRDIRVNGSRAFTNNWTLTPDELASEIRRCIEAREGVPKALALALNVTKCNARYSLPTRGPS